MGRVARITKEMMLEAAFELLDDSGSDAVTITAIAQRVGCSTQPISWHFGSMSGLRRELYYYAGQRMWEGCEERMREQCALGAFFLSGVRYMSLALNHPHVFRFLNVDNPRETIGVDVQGGESVFAQQFDRLALELLAAEYQVPPEVISDAVRDTVIYTHGLALMMLRDQHRIATVVAYRMILDMGCLLLRHAGISIDDEMVQKVYELVQHSALACCRAST